MRSIVISAVASATLMAGGYAIPESSINATALSAAYIANAHGADAAYYNPAAMVYNEDANLLEVDMTYIGLSKIHYASTSGATNIDSESEKFLVPSIHYTSKKLGDNGARVGFSVVVPAGLSKRWTSVPAVYSAEEFTLETVELNPSMAIPLSNTVSMGVGFRVISSSGVVKAKRAGVYSQNMTGDSIDYGYNLALNYRPVSNLSLAATYRSKVNLSVEGDADLAYTGVLAPTVPLPAFSGNYSASVSIPSPATLNLAAAYTFDTATTIEAVYQKTYWSAYKALNFDFSNPYAEGFFGAVKPKNWENTNTYRLGLTQKYDKWTAMAGFAYDETPVPESTLSYELPDSDAWIVSMGGRYQIDKSWNIGLAGLIDMKENREVHNTSINGEFSNARAYLVTAGIEYRF